jgi:predicted chitinase
MRVDTLMSAMPGLARSTAEAYLPPMEVAQRERQITSEARSRMWLAQVGHESLSLRYMEEIADGSAYEGRKDLGNTQPGDGKKYKGRGPIQITGRYNYTAAGAALELDLVNRPELAAQPEHAFRVSAWWWATHGLNEISDTGDVVAATKRINGGLNGLADRQSRYDRCRMLGAAVIPTQPPTEEETVAITAAVNAAGALHVFVEDQRDGSIWYTWQRQGDAAWQGGAPGKGVAGLQPFAPAPK